MIRTAARNATLLAAATLLVGTAAINCSGKKDREDVGSIRLALNLPGGKVLNTVSFTITGNGITPITGNINVADPSATATVLVSSIPAGTGYSVAMNATSTDGTTTCMGSQTFDIIANQTTAVTVGLQCRTGGNTGSGNINGVFNQCPTVSFTASPLVASSPAGVINVSATGMDLDAMQTLTYAWTATGGSFAAAGMATTAYTCAAPGQQTLTITVTDNFTRAGMPQPCSTTGTVVVTCIPLACGNGTLDAGEECEPPGTATCDVNCQRVPNCGDMQIDGNETCDPPNVGPGLANTCSATCQGIPIICGDMLVQPPMEQCDPPNGTTCNAMCQNIIVAPPTCGDGSVNQSTEQCDDGNTTAGDGCENCMIVATACQMCRNTAGMSTDPGSCLPDLRGCAGLATATERAQCQAVLDCIHMSDCPLRTGVTIPFDAQRCYCGTASDGVCLGADSTTVLPNSACRAQIVAAAGAPDINPDTGMLFGEGENVATRFTNPLYPLGRAVNEINCDRESCQAICPL